MYEIDNKQQNEASRPGECPGTGSESRVPANGLPGASMTPIAQSHRRALSHSHKLMCAWSAELGHDSLFMDERRMGATTGLV